MTDQNNDICEEKELYKYLACNDTIHDFGKGADRGADITDIVKDILSTQGIYKEYTPFGNNKNITISNFERSVEEFILYNCNLPGIPESVLAQSPYLISSKLGDTNDVDVKDVEIYRFINKNKNVNYGIKLFSYQVLGLTDKQRENILNEPSNIDPAISFISTIIIEDQVPIPGSDSDIRKIFNWMENELNNEAKITTLLPNSKDTNDRPDIKKNKIGNFLINTFFYAENDSYKGFIYNTDAVSGNLRCAFSAFNNNVLGGIKDTTNYGDSAGTEETGGDDESSSKKNVEKKCGKNKKISVGNNLFDKVVGYFNVNEKEVGKLSIQVNGNPDEMPSLFPASNGEPKGRKVYFFSNNFFTKDDFTIAYVETKDKNWKPYFQPYNFSLCIYSGEKSPELMQKIQDNPEDSTILIGTAPFSSGDNGPSVVYLKQLIIAVYNSAQSNFENRIKGVSPEGKVLNINKLIIDIYNKISGNHTNKKNIIIKLLLDLKRCGDYEQVDAIRMIQDQNEGTNNIVGLQDILFTTGDRLCSLYSRYKKTNVQFFVAGTQRYYLYRQPYIYPSNEVRLEISQKNMLNELKQKAEKAALFMENIEILKNIDLDTFYNDEDNELFSIYNKNEITEILFKNIYLFQKNRLQSIKTIVENPRFYIQKQFSNELESLTYDKIINNTTQFNFKPKSNILLMRDGGNVLDVNETINSFYYLASLEIFSEIDLNDLLPMEIIRNKLPITDVIPTKTTVFLFDFFNTNNQVEIKNKLNTYYTLLKTNYQLLKGKKDTIKFGGTSRSQSVNAQSYLKYSQSMISFLQMCVLIFGSLNFINEKINMLEDINNNLKELMENAFYQKNTPFGNYVVPIATTPSLTVPPEQETVEVEMAINSFKELDTNPDSIFQEIVNNLLQINNQDQGKGIAEENINIKKTKKQIKEAKEKKQIERQQKKENKRKEKMERAILKVKAINSLKVSKLKEVENRKSQRIKVLVNKNSLRSRGTSLEGGGIKSVNIQRGGANIDTLIGDKLEELYQDVNIIAFMNQIYSNIMPYELLLILLTEFDFEYSGVSNELGKMIPLWELPVDLSESNPNYYPMTLSRGKYLLKFQTELRNLIKNKNLGLSDGNKTILESFTEVVTTVVTPDVTEATEETTIEYNTEGLETVLVSEEFDLISSLEEMDKKIKSEKNVPCFLDKINTDIDTKNLINNYLNGMSSAWLTILKELSESEPTDNTDLNTFQGKIFDFTKTGVLPFGGDRGTGEGLSIPSNEVKVGLQNIHLITTLLTIDFSGDACSLQNPFPDTDLSMNTYFTNLNSNLNLETLCKSTNGTTIPRDVPLSMIKNIVVLLFKKQQETEINIRILVMYMLSILGAILFDVTELYFPNFINNDFQIQLLTVIRDGIRTTGSEITVGVTNEEIMEKLDMVIDIILSYIPTKTCDKARAEAAEEAEEAEEAATAATEAATGEEMGGGRKKTKTKKNRKHSKNRSIRFK
jgi:hypothetical protein